MLNKISDSDSDSVVIIVNYVLCTACDFIYIVCF